MNLLHLKYFEELAYSENMQETAKKLHVSASSISAGLHCLEEELGTTLFDRVGRNLRLNDFGKLFLPNVEQAFRSLQQGVKELDDARLYHKRMVSFSIRDAAFWSEIIENFNKLYPDIYIRQVDNDPDDHGKIMEQLDLDFIISDKELNNDRFASCVLFDDYLVLAVPDNHPLITNYDKPRSLFEFRDDTFLFRPKSDYFQQCVDSLLIQIGFKPQKAMEFDYVLRSFVLRQGFGVVITTEQTAKTRLYRHASVIRIKEFEGIPQTKKLYWNKHTLVSPSAITFKEYLRTSTNFTAAQITTVQPNQSARKENKDVEYGAGL